MAEVQGISALFDQYHRTNKSPGVVYGILVDGALVHTQGLGCASTTAHDIALTIDTRFRIASMTKSFVAASCLLLRDAGVLRLDDPVEQWIPSLRGLPLPTRDSPLPTVRHLLSMSAGFPEDGTMCFIILNKACRPSATTQNH
jgi:CubicO group peptidase (beta-lactamase class C family)